MRKSKQTLNEQKNRIMDIISKVDKSFLLNELNEKYMDQILDKINRSGIESLTPKEKEDLDKMSRDEETHPIEKYSLGTTPSTLRFTTSSPQAFGAAGEPVVSPDNVGKLYGIKKTKYNSAYIHGEAMKKAKYDIPIFIDGDMRQLDKPQNEQDIRMLLPEGEYECISTPTIDLFDMAYYLTLKTENVEVNDTDEQDINEGNAFVAAAKKAEEEGKDSFELGGKKYKVTVKKSENKK